MNYDSLYKIPSGRILGYTGKIAIKRLLKERQIDPKRDIILRFKEEGYPTGGLGRSGAEAVGAIVAVSCLLGMDLSTEEVVRFASLAEPNLHTDNVAASCLGGFVITKPLLQKVAVNGLGVVIGISSHQKKGGTESARNVLPVIFSRAELVEQVSLATSMMASIMARDWSSFFELLTQLSFHERARANAGCYGRFGADDLQKLKTSLFVEHRIGMAISGAGPSMVFFYDQHQDWTEFAVKKINSVIIPWLEGRGLNIHLIPTQISRDGARII